MTKGSSAARKKKKSQSPPCSLRRPFKDFHSDWISTLRDSLLPLLRCSLSSSASDDLIVSALAGGALLSSAAALSSHSSAILSHFQSYSHALDLASRRRHVVPHLLAPHPWRSPLELPFLWLGDYHPSLFTNLLRSLPSSKTLATKIDHIERGVRLIAPAIAARYRDAQARFADRAAAEWARSKELLPEELIREQIEDMESIFADANRLRRSVLGEIVAAADVYQGAKFLEALAEFVVGFWDEDLIQEFEQSKVPLTTTSTSSPSSSST